jgi:hypothetical protein
MFCGVSEKIHEKIPLRSHVVMLNFEHGTCDL